MPASEGKATDPFDLQRFVTAQTPVFDTAVAELRAGQKRTHWMWFVFPQLRGLGRSPTAIFYGVASMAEAQAYLAHEILGPRLDLCTRAVLEVRDRTLHQIFGSPDDMKFRSSMTLFGAVSEHPIFAQALTAYCGGEKDQATLDMLARLDSAARP